MKKWETVDLDCWNYLKGAKGGLLKRVRINQERYCTSDCENTYCPLNSDKST